jgi:hypothetical protein
MKRLNDFFIHRINGMEAQPISEIGGLDGQNECVNVAPSTTAPQSLFIIHSTLLINFAK